MYCTVLYIQVAQYWWRWACEVLPRKAKRSDRRMLCHVRSRHDEASTTSHPLVRVGPRPVRTDHFCSLPGKAWSASTDTYPSSCAARSGSARSPISDFAVLGYLNSAGTQRGGIVVTEDLCLFRPLQMPGAACLMALAFFFPAERALLHLRTCTAAAPSHPPAHLEPFLAFSPAMTT